MARTSTKSLLPHPSTAAKSYLVLPVIPLGMSLGLFLVIAYTACVGLYVLFPSLLQNHALLSLFLPGFQSLDWPRFILGLVTSFGYGWAVALVFAPLFNFFSERLR